MTSYYFKTISILMLFFMSPVLLQKLRNRELPIRDQKTDKSNKDLMPSTNVRKTKTELNTCSRCHDLFTVGDKDFQKKGNVNLFCLRLLHVKRCIKKLKKEHPNCATISMFVLDTGVFIKRKKLNCSALNSNNLVNTTMTNKVDIHDDNKSDKIVKKHPKCLPYQEQANVKSSDLKHCGMFGDPHLRTFSDVRQTCVVDGTWSVLENEYYAVQVTNQLVQSTEITSATATHKISIVFKEQSMCLSQAIYEASSTFLPAVFKDGRQFSGPEKCKTEIIKENVDYIKINSCHTNTTITIRRTGSYLNLNILAPNEIANTSRGLCNSGCPSSEIVDSTSFFEKKFNEVPGSIRLPSIKKAMKLCDKTNLTDFYYDSCIFDLLTTGDELFADAAYAAMLDASSLDPTLRLRRENSVVERHTYLHYTERSTSGSWHRVAPDFTLKLLSFLLTFIFARFWCR